MFCVRCGREVGDAPLVGGLCEVCYREENVLARITEHVDLELCVHCGSRRRGELWVDLAEAPEPTIANAVREAVALDRRVGAARIDVELRAEDERNWRAVALVSGTAEGFAFETRLETKARLKNATCLRCSRIKGGYFEAVVQIRAAKRPLTPGEMRRTRAVCSRLIERMVTDGDRDAFVLKDEEVHGGLDVYVGTTNSGRVMAKALTNEFGAKVTEHPKLVGQRDGQELYRITFAVRYPEYAVGDALVLDDQVLLVQSVDPRKVTVRDPMTGRATTVKRDKADKAPVLARSQAREAVVVSGTTTELQVLDPWTLRTVSVLRPEGLEPKDGAVSVLRWDEELVVLPRGGGE